MICQTLVANEVSNRPTATSKLPDAATIRGEKDFIIGPQMIPGQQRSIILNESYGNFIIANL